MRPTDVTKSFQIVANEIPAIRNATDEQIEQALEPYSDATFSSELRQIADVVRGSQKSTDSGKGALANTKAAYDAELERQMTKRVFGNAEPSTEGFQSYLNRLPSNKETSFDEKVAICQTVNYWKKRFKCRFDFSLPSTSKSTRKKRSKAVSCSLEVIPDDGQGTFRLRATSLDPKTRKRANLYSESAFPANLVCRKRERRS